MTTSTAHLIERTALTEALISELRHLMHENHLAAHPGIPFQPRWDILLCMPISVWVVRVAGVAVGYCAHIIALQPFTGQRVATCAAICLQPAHRGLAVPLVHQIERDLAGQVANVSYSVPIESRAAGMLLVHGYECQERVLVKPIHPFTA